MNKDNWKDNPNSLINRWLNDPNPVGVSGKGNPKGKKIEIRKIAEEDIEKYLKEKFDLKE